MVGRYDVVRKACFLLLEYNGYSRKSQLLQNVILLLEKKTTNNNTRNDQLQRKGKMHGVAP